MKSPSSGKGMLRRPLSSLCARMSPGQTLVEFAVLLPVLALLLFGVFEVGRLLQSWVTLQHAVDEAARYAAPGTDYDAGAGVREARIVQVARTACTGLLISAAAGQDAPAYWHVTIRSSRSGGSLEEPDDAGGPNDFVRVEIHYNHPVVTGLFADSYITLHSEALVINERYARPTGEVGHLPPTPPPLPTRTPTPTPGP